MSDLISRSALLERISKVFVPSGGFGMGIQFGIDTAKDWITEAPAVDAVPVVRCKDCKHYYVRTPFCNKLYNWGLIKMTEPEDFCSYGERREVMP